MKRKIPILSLLLLSVCLVTAQTKSHKVPPPPPPAPPVIVKAIEPPPPPQRPRVPPAPPKLIFPKEYIAFLKRNPAVSNINWSDDNRVHIFLKTGKKEVYNLNNSEEVKKLEVKYGKLPPPRPPVED